MLQSKLIEQWKKLWLYIVGYTIHLSGDYGVKMNPYKYPHYINIVFFRGSYDLNQSSHNLWEFRHLNVPVAPVAGRDPGFSHETLAATLLEPWYFQLQTTSWGPRCLTPRAGSWQKPAKREEPLKTGGALNYPWTVFLDFCHIMMPSFLKRFHPIFWWTGPEPAIRFLGRFRNLWLDDTGKVKLELT